MTTTPTPRVGYGFFEYENDWLIEVVGETEIDGAIYVGRRWIEGDRYNVWRTTAGTLIAQTAVITD